jgi:hypothetical protein
MATKLTTLLTQANNALDEAKRQIKVSEVPLTHGQVQALITLQFQVVRLRDTAIWLMREQGWKLHEVAAAFDISPSRVSQIARSVALTKTKRLRLR